MIWTRRPPVTAWFFVTGNLSVEEALWLSGPNHGLLAKATVHSTVCTGTDRVESAYTRIKVHTVSVMPLGVGLGSRLEIRSGGRLRKGSTDTTNPTSNLLRERDRATYAAWPFSCRQYNEISPK